VAGTPKKGRSRGNQIDAETVRGGGGEENGSQGRANGVMAKTWETVARSPKNPKRRKKPGGVNLHETLERMRGYLGERGKRQKVETPKMNVGERKGHRSKGVSALPKLVTPGGRKKGTGAWGEQRSKNGPSKRRYIGHRSRRPIWEKKSRAKEETLNTGKEQQKSLKEFVLRRVAS